MRRDCQIEALAKIGCASITPWHEVDRSCYFSLSSDIPALANRVLGKYRQRLAHLSSSELTHAFSHFRDAVNREFHRRPWIVEDSGACDTSLGRFIDCAKAQTEGIAVSRTRQWIAALERASARLTRKRSSDPRALSPHGREHRRAYLARSEASLGSRANQAAILARIFCRSESACIRQSRSMIDGGAASRNRHVFNHEGRQEKIR